MCVGSMLPPEMDPGNLGAGITPACPIRVRGITMTITITKEDNNNEMNRNKKNIHTNDKNDNNNNRNKVFFKQK